MKNYETYMTQLRNIRFDINPIQDYYHILMFELLTELEINSKDLYIANSPSFVDKTGKDRLASTRGLKLLVENDEFSEVKELLLNELMNYRILYLYEISISKTKDPNSGIINHIIKYRGYFE